MCALTDRPWPEAQPGRKPITEHWLAQRLRPFGVLPHTLRVGEQRAKGYEQADFTDAFERFLTQDRLQVLRESAPLLPAATPVLQA